MRPESAGIVARFVVCVVDSWRWALSCGVAFSGEPCLLGQWWLDGLVSGETEEEHLRNLVLRRSDVDDDGASCHTASTKTIHVESSRASSSEVASNT